jgi:hypothetical protein
MIIRVEEVSPIFPKLRVAKGKKFVVTITNLYAIAECSVNSSEKLIISLLLGT